MVRFWMSAEVDAKVYDDFRVIRAKIEADVKSLVKQHNYGKGLKNWSVLPIVLSTAAKRDVFPEIKKVDLKKRECEFRLHVPLMKFREADMPTKFEMIKEVILRSLQLTEEAGIAPFEFDRLHKDIQSLKYSSSKAPAKSKPSPSKQSSKQKAVRPRTRGTAPEQPLWKSKWPRSDSLRAWLRCMIDKCEVIEDGRKGADEAHLPINGLAELGHTAEALKYVRRFLKRLPNRVDIETVRMLELGAEIELIAGSIEKAEQWLEKVLRLDNSHARKCDRDFPSQSVLDFKILHGLLDPAQVDDARQAERASANRAERLAKEMIDGRKFAKARQPIELLESIARATDDELMRSLRYQSVLEFYFRLKDSASVRRVLRKMSKEDRESAVPYSKFAELELHREAIRRAERQINADLDELASMDVPNIHFPASSLCDAIEFLSDAGETKRARRLLKRTLRECEDWPVYEFGWTTSAVYAMLARAVAKVDGPEQATKLMESAHDHAGSEKRTDWRKGSVRSAIELEADLGYLDDAIARARKLRSPRERRFATAKLLARARRWKELREVCHSVRNPLEAAELCWAIKFQLPGGEPR